MCHMSWEALWQFPFLLYLPLEVLFSLPRRLNRSPQYSPIPAVVLCSSRNSFQRWAPLPFPPGAPSSVTILLSNFTIPPRHASFLWWVHHFSKQCPSPSHCQAHMPPPLGCSATSCVHWFQSCSPAKSSVFSVALHSVVKTREDPPLSFGAIRRVPEKYTRDLMTWAVYRNTLFSPFDKSFSPRKFKDE